MKISVKRLLKDYDDKEREAIMSYWSFIRASIEDAGELRDILVHRLGKFYMVGSSLNLLHIRLSRDFARGYINYDYYKDVTLKIFDICISKADKWKNFKHVLVEIKIRFLSNKSYVLKGVKEQCQWASKSDYVEEINI